MIIFTIILDILASQCFFATVSYLIEIFKKFILQYIYNRYSKSNPDSPNNVFFDNYGFYIQSIVGAILFLIIGLIVFSIADYVKRTLKKNKE